MRIDWKIPSRAAKSANLVEADESLSADQYFNSPIPYVSDAASPLEELLTLLKVAAEVEHALMIQYLYAADSINDESDTVKETFLKVAKQEMGHLLALQNLLLSVGGIEALHLHKSQLRPASGSNPLPFTLEPVSRNLIAKFVAIEAPIDVPTALQAEVETIREIAVQKSGTVLNPVGGLYMKIFWLFQPDDAPVADLISLSANADLGRPAGWHISDNDFKALSEITKFEALATTWADHSSFGSNHLILEQIHTRRSALELIDHIALQGEGADFDDTTETHFELFLKTYRAFDDNPPVISNLPINPVTAANHEFEIAVMIENEYSLLWSRLLCLVYTSLLLDIYSSMFYTQFKLDDKNSFVRLIFSCMRSGISPMSKVIVKLPLLNNGFQYDADPRCGPTFEIDADFSLSSKRSEMDNFNSGYIEKILTTIDAIKNHPTFNDHLSAEETQDPDLEVGAEGVLLGVGSYCSLKKQLILE